MITQIGKNFREQLRLLVRGLGLLEKAGGASATITIVQCHALVELGRRAPISLNDLAQILGVDKSTMSRTIGHLDKAGLVHREIDKSNRRYIAIQLTPKGQKTYADIEESSGSYYQSVFDLIPAGKQNQVLESLELIYNALCEMDHKDIQKSEREVK